MQFTIQHLTGSRAGTSQQVEGTIVRMGRDPSSEVAFDPHADDAVSASHCQLVVGPQGGVSVVDVGSSNGTLVNGQRIQPHAPTPLISGAVLRLGEEGPKVSVVFVTAAGTTPVTQPARPAAKGGSGRLALCLALSFVLVLIGVGGAAIAYYALVAGDAPADPDSPDDPEASPGADPSASPAPSHDASAGADDAADLSHVAVGQVYVYAMSGGMVSEWTVDAVGENEVTYTAVNKMDMGQGLQPLGEPNQQTWRYEVPQATSGEVSDAPEPKTRREAVTVGGVEFDCLVVESEAGGTASTSWGTMSPGSDHVPTFPGALKVISAGDTVMELTEIRQPE